jgi:hypothetical protein
MMTLKLALLATTAAGAVAAAGGITYATVGNSSDAPSAQTAKNAAVAPDHQRAAEAPALPQLPAVPTCLPTDLPRAEAIAKVKKQLKEITQKASQLNGAASKLTLPKVPVDKLPLCKAGTGGSTSPTSPIHPPTLPGKPGLEVPAAVSCDSVPAVIKNEEARAKDFTLPNGMHVGAAHVHSVVIKSRAACVYTQEFIGGLAQLITVDRITTPPQVTLRELAASLKMPGSFVKVSGIETWRSPVNSGMLWYSNKGYAIRVAGTNPAATALIPVIASQLRAG